MFCTIASMSLQASDVQVARYSLLKATPTDAQVELLATTINVKFPERILTVGEAIRYLLLRSGYRLARDEVIESDTKALFALPLPAVHKNLGPMVLRAALETLAGKTFNLIEDPVHRLVTFERCISGRDGSQVSADNINREVVQDDE
jgi:type IV pili sensor histidine kinase/response regulator